MSAARGAGFWVAFEGGEGSGKSTQARLLADRLGAVVTREPGGTAIGQSIRRLLLDPASVDLDARAEALLMAVDRAQHFVEVVAPTMEAGRDVVSDRSAFSSLAYQGFGRGLDVDELVCLSSWATCDVWPDVAILLDVPAAARERRQSGTPDRFEAEDADFHLRVEDGYRRLAAGDPERWIIVDGSGTVGDVEARVAGGYARWLEGRR